MVRASVFGVRLSTLALLLATGCVSKQASDEQARRAFDAGLQQGRKEAELRLTQVLIRGPVRNPTVPWREGLTLAQALVDAVYTAANDPTAISITRDNRILPVDVNELLRGVDYPVEPGDLIDIR